MLELAGNSRKRELLKEVAASQERALFRVEQGSIVEWVAGFKVAVARSVDRRLGLDNWWPKH
ncbi:hypothetical protein JCGZ_10862 [Jatropha curcas]|uniref:Uncharacterized protein n=1 Tax=Jatropha curcas TaxID=180498 RepID=A0A067KUD0_JATCU|nr:hypothetical protein JCGZ_10862 [Jatropha curcas]